MTFISGEKIILKGISEENVTADYLSWINDFEITSGLVTGYFPTSMSQLHDYVSQVSKKSNAAMFVICDKATGEHVGNIKLDNIDWIGRTAEMGLMIGSKNAHGKGFGYESCKLTINYAFEKLNLRKVHLAVFDNNPGAIRLYEKLGFVKEGTMRSQVFKDGKYWDKIIMGIFKEELK